MVASVVDTLKTVAVIVMVVIVVAAAAPLDVPGVEVHKGAGAEVTSLDLRYVGE